MSDDHDANWSAPDLTAEAKAEVQAIAERLTQLFPAPPWVDPNNLTEEDAYTVMRAARRMLVVQLLAQEYHQHMMDDCGDYLAAATWGWQAVFADAWNDDFQGYTDHIRTYLTDLEKYPPGGCDGEVRHALISDFDPYEED